MESEYGGGRVYFPMCVGFELFGLMRAGCGKKGEKATREAFCRNINFPFFTLMLLCCENWKSKKSERKKQHEKGESGKFKGSTFFLDCLCRCLPGVLLDKNKSLCLSIIYDKYKKKENPWRRNFSIYTFPSFSGTISYYIFCVFRG